MKFRIKKQPGLEVGPFSAALPIWHNGALVLMALSPRCLQAVHCPNYQKKRNATPLYKPLRLACTVF